MVQLFSSGRPSYLCPLPLYFSVGLSTGSPSLSLPLSLFFTSPHCLFFIVFVCCAELAAVTLWWQLSSVGFFRVSGTLTVWFSLGSAETVPGVSLSVSTCLLSKETHIHAITPAALLPTKEMTSLLTHTHTLTNGYIYRTQTLTHSPYDHVDIFERFSLSHCVSQFLLVRVIISQPWLWPLVHHCLLLVNNLLPILAVNST